MDTNQTTKSREIYGRRTEISPPQLHPAARELKHLRHFDLSSLFSAPDFSQDDLERFKPNPTPAISGHLQTPKHGDAKKRGKQARLVERLGFVPRNHVENNGRKRTNLCFF
jgi:hypothetical protein